MCTGVEIAMVAGTLLSAGGAAYSAVEQKKAAKKQQQAAAQQEVMAADNAKLQQEETAEERKAGRGMNIRYFWNMKIRAPVMRRLWAYWHDTHYPLYCGNVCDWVYPYGFVPEADCPYHDK